VAARSIALRVDGLTRGNAVRDVSFEVHRGEILGLSGLVGSGRTETLRAIVGADTPDAGRVARGDGVPLRIGGPRDAVRAGIGMVPEDRKAQALLLSQSVRANTSLAVLSSMSTARTWVEAARERARVQQITSDLDVRCTSIEQAVSELSGGNQQKVVMARWLLRDCDVLLLDEPTRGIDIGAKRAIHHLLADLAAHDKALVVVSSELDELMAICDRIVVLSAGRVTGTFVREAWSEADLMAAAFAGYAAPAVPLAAGAGRSR
jgi:ribose transport system ATP-binding protein